MVPVDPDCHSESQTRLLLTTGYSQGLPVIMVHSCLFLSFFQLYWLLSANDLTHTHTRHGHGRYNFKIKALYLV